MAVFGNMAVDQPYFLALDRRIAFSDRPFAVAKRLHLGAGQLDPSLEPFLYEIIEARTPVFSHDFLFVERLRKRLGHTRVRSALHARGLRRQHASNYRT